MLISQALRANCLENQLPITVGVCLYNQNIIRFFAREFIFCVISTAKEMANSYISSNQMLSIVAIH